MHVYVYIHVYICAYYIRILLKILVNKVMQDFYHQQYQPRLGVAPGSATAVRPWRAGAGGVPGLRKGLETLYGRS